jgi:beta-lactamase class A
VDTRAVVAGLNSDTAGLQGNYAVAVIDLATGSTYGINSETSFRAASLNKMPILISLYQRAAAGGVNLDQSLVLGDEDIQHYGTGLIQDPESSRSYTLRELAALMIEASDNTAAHVLERFLGQATIQADVDRWGLTRTSMADNATTGGDTASLFSRLYRDELLPASATEISLTLLQHTVFNDRLASGLPPGVAIAHKVGSDVAVFNDAGIVLAPGHPYVVAMLSQDADEGEAAKAFASISRRLYRFELSLPAADAR